MKFSTNLVMLATQAATVLAQCGAQREALAADAAACANQLAARGGQGCGSITTGFTREFCRIASARVTGVGVGPPGQSSESSCNDIARAVGTILDRCTRPNGLVSGQNTAFGNGNINVDVRAS